MNFLYIIKRRGGFTLLELLVAIGVFALLVSIAVGGFLRALRTQRQVAALVAVNSNVSLVLEEMLKDMRYGKNFSPPPGGDPGIQFDTLSERNVVYRLQNDGTHGWIERGALDPVSNAIVYASTTAENVDIRYFNIAAADPGEDPPRFVVSIDAAPVTQDTAISSDVTHFQTSVTPRP